MYLSSLLYLTMSLGGTDIRTSLYVSLGEQNFILSPFEGPFAVTESPPQATIPGMVRSLRLIVRGNWMRLQTTCWNSSAGLVMLPIQHLRGRRTSQSNPVMGRFNIISFPGAGRFSETRHPDMSLPPLHPFRAGAMVALILEPSTDSHAFLEHSVMWSTECSDK